MKKLFTFFVAILLLLPVVSWGQPWAYGFGTSTGSYSTASGTSTTFLPQPDNGSDFVRIGSGSGSINLENQAITFGNESYIRSVAPTGASVNKISLYDYSAGKSFTLKFQIRLGANDGSATGASSGNWYMFIGDGASYSNANAFSTTEVFTGIRWAFGSSGTITTNFRSGATWSATGLSGTPFTQGTTYSVEIYGNNTTGALSYTYGTSQTVASNKFDLWVEGVLVGDDLSKGGIVADANIDSFMFYGESSTSNVANIFLDNFIYTNQIASTPLPVQLTSFTASTVEGGVKLNWETATEVNNYGFNVERLANSQQLKANSWEKIGFVQGNGNSNSPKSYSFTDNAAPAGKVQYRLKQMDFDGKFEYSAVAEVEVETPNALMLYQNSPNPFNPETVIRYKVQATSQVTLKVYDVLGNEVATLVNEVKEPGSYNSQFSIFNFSPRSTRVGAGQLSSGVYFYRLTANGISETKKMILMK